MSEITSVFAIVCSADPGKPKLYSTAEKAINALEKKYKDCRWRLGVTAYYDAEKHTLKTVMGWEERSTVWTIIEMPLDQNGEP